MPDSHILDGMIERLRALRIVIEEGSVNRASLRLRIGQPALSRQIQALEGEVGGRLLERTPAGVEPTGLGHALMKSMTPVIAGYDEALAEVRRQARGERAEVRVGYLISAAQSVLSPALDAVRLSHPEVKVRLLDLSPREQIAALRAGEIDLALIGQEGRTAAKEFHCLTLNTLGVCVALAADDPLSAKTRISLGTLKGRDFLGIDETEMPGRNQWISSLCRSAGFKARLVASVDGVTHVLSRIASESFVTLLPAYFLGFTHPGVVFRPLVDTKAGWDFILLRQKGRMTPAMRALVDALQESASRLD